MRLQTRTRALDPKTEKYIMCQHGRYGDQNCKNHATYVEESSWNLGLRGVGTSFYYFCDGCMALQIEGYKSQTPTKNLTHCKTQG